MSHYIFLPFRRSHCSFVSFFPLIFLLVSLTPSPSLSLFLPHFLLLILVSLFPNLSTTSFVLVFPSVLSLALLSHFFHPLVLSSIRLPSTSRPLILSSFPHSLYRFLVLSFFPHPLSLVIPNSSHPLFLYFSSYLFHLIHIITIPSLSPKPPILPSVHLTPFHLTLMPLLSNLILSFPPREILESGSWLKIRQPDQRLTTTDFTIQPTQELTARKNGQTRPYVPRRDQTHT